MSIKASIKTVKTASKTELNNNLHKPKTTKRNLKQTNQNIKSVLKSVLK